MSQKIETTITADNSKFVKAISDATKAANDVSNTLSSVSENANRAAGRIDAAADVPNEKVNAQEYAM